MSLFAVSRQRCFQRKQGPEAGVEVTFMGTQKQRWIIFGVLSILNF